VGTTINESLRSYKNALNSPGNRIELNSESEITQIRDVINRINSDVREGNTFYYLTIAGRDGIFVGTSLLSPELILSNKGDSVVLQIEGGKTNIIDLVNFDNLGIK
jgi:hypothetical protein